MKRWLICLGGGNMHRSLGREFREVERQFSLLELEQHAASVPEFAQWRAGYGPVLHQSQTQSAVVAMAQHLVAQGRQPSVAAVYQLLQALDRLTAAGMWLVVHMTYAQRVRLDGADLVADDFKVKPEGHTGGSLNMVPAYAAYLAWNALTGQTRSWLMGQGHSVAAVEALNVLVGNLHPEQQKAYGGARLVSTAWYKIFIAMPWPQMAALLCPWAAMST